MDNLGKNLGMEIGSNFGETAAISPITDSGNFDFYISSFTSTTIGDPDDDLYGNYIPEFVFRNLARTFMEAAMGGSA